MRMRRDRGFSMIELLAVLALLGGFVIAVADLHGGLLREARDAERSDDAFERRELALMRFRAAARRATAARQDGEGVVLRDAAGEAAWCVLDDVPRRAEPSAPCEQGGLRVERRARGTLVRLRAAGMEEAVLVGAAGGRP